MVLGALIIPCSAPQLHECAASLPAPASLGQLSPQKIKYHPHSCLKILLIQEECLKPVLPTPLFLFFHAPQAVKKNLANGLTSFGKLVGSCIIGRCHYYCSRSAHLPVQICLFVLHLYLHRLNRTHLLKSKGLANALGKQREEPSIALFF